MTVQVTYEGELHTDSVHIQSGARIATDAPVDNHGRGESFSPTDMVASALASCMLTIMGIKAQEMNIDLRGTKAEVTKIMTSNPRRIGEISIVIRFPKLDLSEKQKTIFERVAHTCPVALTLDPGVVQTISLEW
jgi:uncharacterized OsmC-like protein